MASSKEETISSKKKRRKVPVTDVGQPMDGYKRPKPTGKKRKREDDSKSGELEIDLALPEPPSKKALRKAKKQQPAVPLYSATAASHGEDEEIKLVVTEESSTPAENRNRSQWGIWVGNLPWTATKQDVCNFITSKAGLNAAAVTRINMPAPRPDKRGKNEKGKGGSDYHNKGFAYIDFDSEDHQKNALALTETQYPGNTRKVLIKDSKSFEGRPAEHANRASGNGLSAAKANAQKPPSKRIFVGNLTFDTTRDSLLQHYSQCGPVVDVFMATFEDSGKSKGYAWVTFDGLEPAEAAVKGWVMRQLETKDQKEAADTEPATNGKPKKSSQRRKWFVNRLNGRELRVEYAEAADVRYKKRFGKGTTAVTEESGGQGEGVEEITESVISAADNKEERSSAHERRKIARKAEKDKRAPRIKGAAASGDSKNAGAIVASQGQKIIFDDD